MMNDEERYLFDLQGFLVLPNALSMDQVALLNAAIDDHVAQQADPEKPWFRQDNLLGWGLCFQDLIDPPAIAPYLQALLGEDYRLDHDYLHIIRKPGPGPIGSYLHGGATPYDPCQYYHVQDGRMYNGLTAIAYNLTDVYPGDGGFGCIPGSHKSRFPLPQGWEDLTQPPACVQEVIGRAGTAILFTEALTHGTLPWRGQSGSPTNGSSERRTLFYKYSPRSIAWSYQYYDLSLYPHLPEAQKQRLRPPGVDSP